MSVFDTRRYLIPFRSSLLPQIFCDTLVVGTGVGGLRAGIAAAAHGEVIVLGKDDPGTSNTAWAQGGIAAVTTPDDSIEKHVHDTLVAGAGLCDEPVVRSIIGAGPERLGELIDWGMRLDLGADGKPARGLEGGHSLARILHADGDATGRELVRCLWEKIKSTAGVRVFSKCFALDLITAGSEPGSPVLGAITWHPKHGLQMIWAKATILATGGAGMVYRETTNPRSATADGIAMAYRAGASVADMAFIQFHPTCLYIAGAARSLISEAVRGAGAHLVDADGLRFMTGEHELGELAPRDVVTRGIIRRLSARGGTHVFLDCRHITGFTERFPGIAQVLRKFEIDPATDLVPVHPAAHYTIGGVLTDALGRSDVPGLYVVGESACTGLHGANRLASNSLLEGLVMGEIAGRVCRERTHPENASRGTGPLPPGWELPPRPMPIPIVSDIRPSELGELDLDDVERSLRSAMWRNVGIERLGSKLLDAEHMVEFWGRYTLDKIFDDARGWQIQNLLLAAWLIARSAAWRAESRGCHWRSDHPLASDRLLVHDGWRRGQSGPVLHALPGTRTPAGALA